MNVSFTVTFDAEALKRWQKMASKLGVPVEKVLEIMVSLWTNQGTVSVTRIPSLDEMFERLDFAGLYREMHNEGKEPFQIGEGHRITNLFFPKGEFEKLINFNLTDRPRIIPEQPADLDLTNLAADEGAQLLPEIDLTDLGNNEDTDN